MTRYIVRRILNSIFVLFIIITVSLWITRLAPSNPCQKEKEANTCSCLKNYQLDRPVFPVYTPPATDPVQGCQFWQPDSVATIGSVHVLGPSEWDATQYGVYMERLVFGWSDNDNESNPQNDRDDSRLGPSMRNQQDVGELLSQGLPYTMQLGLQALLLALLIGVPAGMFAGLKQNTIADYTTMTVAMVGVAVPNFVLGPLLILFFAEGQMGFGWFTPTGWDSFADSILPTITLSLYYAAYIARLTRGGMLEMIRKDFVRTARAKGLSEGTVVRRHTFKGTILPVVSYLGPAFAALLTGSVVVEQIFSLPGIGRYFVESALNRDYNMVLGAVVIYASLLISLNLVVDILYTVIDPRVDYEDEL